MFCNVTKIQVRSQNRMMQMAFVVASDDITSKDKYTRKGDKNTINIEQHQVVARASFPDFYLSVWTGRILVFLVSMHRSAIHLS